MSAPAARPAPVPQSLGRLRLRLTAWYVGTFLAVLLLVGIGVFAMATRSIDAELDLSLRGTATHLVNLVHERGVGAATAAMIVPERQLSIVDSAGRVVSGAPIDPWLGRLARRAIQRGARAASHAAPGDRVLRAFALPFSTERQRLAAVVVADEVEIEDKYASLIATAAITALIALVLVGAGGWILARKSTAPVEETIAHMRRFMADAAHELRTPLSVVRSRAEIALERPRDSNDYQDALREIERETIRVGRIVEDLLMLARADAGERPIERQRVFLDDVTLDAAKAAQAIADRRGVRVEIDEFDEVPVLGDALLLRQLALILFDNAIKFSRDRGTVRITVRRTNAVGTLTVADQGLGIPAEHLPHVRERFYRGDAARTRNASGVSEGAGLGLSIAQWIVEEHGATLAIESEVGVGTRVTVKVPIDEGSVMSSS